MITIIVIALYGITIAFSIVVGIRIGARTVYRKEVYPRDIDPEKYYEVRYSSSYSHYIARKSQKEK